MKTVFITGADRGIGYSLCEVFLQHGFRVLAGRFMTDWHELDRLKESHPDLYIIPLDVSDSSSIAAAAAEAVDITDNIDILVNVAGVHMGESPAEVEKLMTINSVAPIAVTKAFLPLMKSGMKRLCYFSSEAGSISLAHRTGDFGYCMSKAALNMAVKMLFNSLQPKGYTFRLYHPGWVNTYMAGHKQNIAPYEAIDTAITAYDTFTGDKSCESVLVMTDINRQTWSF